MLSPTKVRSFMKNDKVETIKASHLKLSRIVSQRVRQFVSVDLAPFIKMVWNAVSWVRNMLVHAATDWPEASYLQFWPFALNIQSNFRMFCQIQ